MEDYKGYLNNLVEKCELEKLENMKNDCKVSIDKKHFLMDIIAFKTLKDIKVPEKKNKTNTFSSELDKYIYQRPWSKLAYEQKRIKLIEYIDESLINISEDNYQKTKKILLEDLKNKKLDSAKIVSYDSLKHKIMSIKGLKYDSNNKKFSYNLSEEKPKKKRNYYRGKRRY